MDYPWISHVWFIPLSTKTHFESDVVYSTFDKICGLFHFRKTTHKDGWYVLDAEEHEDFGSYGGHCDDFGGLQLFRKPPDSSDIWNDGVMAPIGVL